MAVYYVLASANRALATTGHFEWPFQVAIAFEGTKLQIGLLEGVGAARTAHFLTPADALHIAWAIHFANSHAAWLLPIVRQLALDENVSPENVLSMYREIHGAEPIAFERATEL